jgi:hypothetical protein
MCHDVLLLPGAARESGNPILGEAYWIAYEAVKKNLAAISGSVGSRSLIVFGMTDRLNCHSEQSEESFLMPDNELAIPSEPLPVRQPHGLTVKHFRTSSGFTTIL